jgi:hypothetical protein
VLPKQAVLTACEDLQKVCEHVKGSLAEALQRHAQQQAKGARAAKK